VIVRIMGEGQYTLDDTHAELLNSLDSGLEAAVEAGDESAYQAALVDLLAKVRTLGTPLADDALDASDAVLPAEGSHIDDVRDMLGASDEGLIPG